VWSWPFLLALALLQPNVCRPASPVAVAPEDVIDAGYATFYSPGVMQVVVSNRQLSPCSECTGYAAVRECERIGQFIRVRWQGKVSGKLQIADCVRPEHEALMVSRGRVVELDWETWQAMGLPLAPTWLEIVN
jgi:hypothetical protein